MINFKDELKKLEELQKLDGQIYDKKRELTEHPVRVQELKKEMEAGRSQLTSLSEGFQRIQLERKNKEMELTGKEENVKKYQSQQLQVKSNKEYAALQHEIDTLKADNSMLEEEVIGLLDEIDRVGSEVEKEKKACEAEEKQTREQEAIFRKEGEKIQQSLKTIEAQRNKLAAQVDQKTLTTYEKVLRRWEGVGLVPVEGAACGGCFTNLPPQVINEIKLARDIIACERCARILYVRD